MDVAVRAAVTRDACRIHNRPFDIKIPFFSKTVLGLIYENITSALATDGNTAIVLT